MRPLCSIIVLCSPAHISISVNGRVAGVLCSSTLPLSDKTMTQYDEKQRCVSAIVFIEKDDTVVNSHALCVGVCVLEGLP